MKLKGFSRLGESQFRNNEMCNLKGLSMAVRGANCKLRRVKEARVEILLRQQAFKPKTDSKGAKLEAGSTKSTLGNFDMVGLKIIFHIYRNGSLVFIFIFCR